MARRGKERKTISPLRLDVVHRDVRILNERVDGITVVRIYRDADARAGTVFLLADAKWLAQAQRELCSRHSPHRRAEQYSGVAM